ncbi:MAG: hypothetical protein WCC48_04565 [Anaeromyxobacteraceae bacterium]
MKLVPEPHRTGRQVAGQDVDRLLRELERSEVEEVKRRAHSAGVYPLPVQREELCLRLAGTARQ